MKVAILSPQPRISGVVTYSHQLARGFRDLGHDCQVVTFTLSGKGGASTHVEAVDAKRSGWGWSALGYDRVGKWQDAAAVLAEYDLVVVEEPRCAPLDKKQMRKIGGGDIKAGRAGVADLDYEELPQYVHALSYLRHLNKTVKVAWTLHDPGYGPRLAPFLEHLSLWAPPDLVITHRDGSLASAAWAGIEAPELRIEHLPYTMKKRQAYEKIRGIATTGRYINNKGQPTLFLAAALGYTPDEWDVVALGASPLGAGPNHTFLTFEGLTTRYGLTGTRHGKDVTRGWPWIAASQAAVVRLAQRELEARALDDGGSHAPGVRGVAAAIADDGVATDDGAMRPSQAILCAYKGPYQDPVEALRPYAVHACLTDPGFSGSGSLEYVQLEAIDAECLLVMHASRAPKTGAPKYFEVAGDMKLANAELWPVDEARRDTAMSVGWAVRDAADMYETSPRETQEIIEHNARVVNFFHDPAKYAEKVIRALF